MKCDHCNEDCGTNTVDGWYCFECSGMTDGTDLSHPVHEDDEHYNGHNGFDD